MVATVTFNGEASAGRLDQTVHSSSAQKDLSEQVNVPEVLVPDEFSEAMAETTTGGESLSNLSAWSALVLDDSPGVSGAFQLRGGGDMWNEAISEKQATLSRATEGGVGEERVQRVKSLLEADRNRGIQSAQAAMASKRLEEEREREQIKKMIEEKRNVERQRREAEDRTVNLDQHKEDLALLLTGGVGDKL